MHNRHITIEATARDRVSPVRKSRGSKGRGTRISGDSLVDSVNDRTFQRNGVLNDEVA